MFWTEKYSREIWESLVNLTRRGIGVDIGLTFLYKETYLVISISITIIDCVQHMLQLVCSIDSSFQSLLFQLQSFLEQLVDQVFYFGSNLATSAARFKISSC